MSVRYVEPRFKLGRVILCIIIIAMWHSIIFPISKNLHEKALIILIIVVIIIRLLGQTIIPHWLNIFSA